MSASLFFLGPLPILHLLMKEGMYLAVLSDTQGEPRKLDLPHQAQASVSVPFRHFFLDLSAMQPWP